MPYLMAGVLRLFSGSTVVGHTREAAGAERAARKQHHHQTSGHSRSSRAFTCKLVAANQALICDSIWRRRPLCEARKSSSIINDVSGQFAPSFFAAAAHLVPKKIYALIGNQLLCWPLWPSRLVRSQTRRGPLYFRSAGSLMMTLNCRLSGKYFDTFARPDLELH